MTGCALNGTDTARLVHDQFGAIENEARRCQTKERQSALFGCRLQQCPHLHSSAALGVPKTPKNSRPDQPLGICFLTLEL